MSEFSIGGSDEKPKEAGFNIMDLAPAVMMAFQTGDWTPALDKVKPLISPAIGNSLIDYDKAGAQNCSYIITKKADKDGYMMVFLSVIERPEQMQYVLDKDGQPIVKEVGDLLDLLVGGNKETK